MNLIIICFSGTAGVTFNPPSRASKIFIAFQQINVKNRRHIANYQFNRALFTMFTRNSGAPSPTIRHHLLKVGIFHGTSSGQKGKKNLINILQLKCIHFFADYKRTRATH